MDGSRSKNEMKKRVPRVSLGVPVYNGETFLAHTLESLLAQTFNEIEVIISDNASTDRTQQICKSFAARDPRVEYIRQDHNLGASANYNFVARRSHGEYFKWAAHDDLCEPTFVERCVELLDENKDAVVAYPRSVLISDAGDLIEPVTEDMSLPWDTASRRLRHFLWNTSLCHPVFGLIRSSALARTGLIGPFHSSDVIVLIQLLLQGKFIEYPESLFLRRMHAGTSLWNKSDADVIVWYDTSASRKHAPALRYTTLFATAMKSVLRSPIPLWDKPICWMILARAYATRRREIAGELVRATRGIVRKRERRTPAADVG
jgi:glycosyltransferase involved in cell wall biosynthesis